MLSTSEPGFEQLKATLLFAPQDVCRLHELNSVLQGCVDEVLDTWYGTEAASHASVPCLEHPCVPASAHTPAGRAQLTSWLLATTSAAYDGSWLFHQQDLRARRHRDGATPHPSELSALRCIVSFLLPLTITLRPFLARSGHARSEIDNMEQAWFKAVTLTAALWAQPFPSSKDD